MDKQLISNLVANKEEAIKLKKAAIKQCDTIVVEETTSKAFSYANSDNLESGIITRKIVANTYNYLDSHGDVHIKGIFTKSIQENKQMHLHDHIYQLCAKVGTIQSVDEVLISWRELGVEKEGKTIALIVSTDIKRSYNEPIYLQYLGNEINQHSVGMQYVKIELCINDEQYEQEYAMWNKYFSNIANGDEAIKQGYFWAVTEAKLIEVSCVIAGSNPITPTLQPKKTKEEPIMEPSKDTQEQSLEIDYKYLIKEFNLKNK